MTLPDAPFPDFTDPPVVEVVLGVQFEPIADLGTAQLGLVWQKFRQQGFSKTEDQPPLAPTVEQFGARRPFRVGVELELVDAPSIPRLWFLNQPETELIQIQRDRFMHNWRKVRQGEVYPRFEQLRAAFERELNDFSQHLRDEKLGDLVPTQCEVTYVNEIVSGAGWERHGQLGAVLTLWQAPDRDTVLPEPEDVQLGIRYVIPNDDGEPQGRLNITVAPAYRVEGPPIMLMNLTARGKPEGEGIEGALRFIERGRAWLVHGFTSITTPDMHRIWGKYDGRQPT